MRRAIYIPMIISLLAQCSGTEPDMKESYTAEYFFFDLFRGIGVVSVPNSSGSYDIPVLAEPGEGAHQIASLVAELSSYEKRFSIKGDTIAEDALFEFAYEHLGLPVEVI